MAFGLQKRTAHVEMLTTMTRTGLTRWMDIDFDTQRPACRNASYLVVSRRVSSCRIDVQSGAPRSRGLRGPVHDGGDKLCLVAVGGAEHLDRLHVVVLWTREDVRVVDHDVVRQGQEDGVLARDGRRVEQGAVQMRGHRGRLLGKHVVVEAELRVRAGR